MDTLGPGMELFRVILPVPDIDAAARFWGAVLDQEGERVTSGRHYFHCGNTILACLDPIADGDPEPSPPNHGHVYLTTAEPLDQVRLRAVAAGAVPDAVRGSVGRRPWGETSFYAQDPWGNPFCFVEAGSEYRGGAF